MGHGSESPPYPSNSLPLSLVDTCEMFSVLISSLLRTTWKASRRDLTRDSCVRYLSMAATSSSSLIDFASPGRRYGSVSTSLSAGKPVIDSKVPAGEPARTGGEKTILLCARRKRWVTPSWPPMVGDNRAL